MKGIRCDVAIFFNADGTPFAKGYLSVRPSTRDTCRAALLLPSVDPVGELVVGDDVIKLGGRLVVPGTPGFAAVHRDQSALITGQENDGRVFRVDPNRVIVVSTGRAFDGGKCLARVSGSVGGSIGDINNVFDFRVDFDFGEIVSSPPESAFVVNSLPTLAGIIGAIN